MFIKLANMLASLEVLSKQTKEKDKVCSQQIVVIYLVEV